MAIIASFTLQSATTQSAAPFSIGHVFKKGAVPSGVSLVGSITDLQVVPKNTWPDGSLRFAVVSGRAVLSAGVALTISLSTGTPSAASSLTTANLKATSVVASIGTGTFGSVSWSGTDWDSPWQTWISGPSMSSWVYRKPIGSDPQLVGFIEVRLFAGGEVEILPWIENGYLQAPGSSISAAPVNKNDTYSFTLGGTQRCSVAVDLCARTRTPIINGSALSYWLGSDPQVVPRHDVAYMQSTALVPAYGSSVASPTLQTTYVPKAQGGFTYSQDAMGGTGPQSPIGLLPLHDVLYLVSTDSGAFASVVRNGYSAGRYPVYYRDENTNRPLKFSSYPKLSDNSSSAGLYPATSTGTAAPVWDVAHHPSMGYMAYLLTGSWYHMETIQFAATRNYLRQVDQSRQFEKGIFMSWSGASTTRGAAWANRTILQAVLATPDGDALHSEMVASLTANIAYNYSTYVAQPNNPFGFVAPYGDAYGTTSDGTVQEAFWQQDFYTAAYGYMLAADPPIDSTTRGNLADFFTWKAQSIIGRLGGEGSTEWPWYDAAQYQAVVALEDTPDWIGGTGPWASSWNVLYQATQTVLSALGKPMATGTSTSMRGGNTEDPYGYWTNLTPAIAYAVQHDVTGALAGYSRMAAATNFDTIQANMSPVWRVVSLTNQEGQQTVTTTCTLVDSARLRSGYTVVSKYRGRGIPASAIPSTGDNGPALLYNDIDTVNDPVGTEYRLEMPTPTTSAGVAAPFKMYEDSSFEIIGAADGVYTSTENVYKNGTLAYTEQFSATISSAAATVTSVSVSPSTASILGSATQQFAATVLGTNNPAQTVTWTATAGIINSSGLFTAPAATSSAQTITITATSTIDGTKSGTASVTIAASVAPPATVSSVTVTPGTVSLAGFSKQQFSATVTGTNSPSQVVSWSATGGTIDANGLFTAPASNGSVQTFTVTATSALDGTKSGVATVTIPALSPSVSSVTVSPSSGTVQGGSQIQFASVVNGQYSPSQSVTWNASAGSITSAGLWTAPATTVTEQIVTISAVSMLDPSKIGTATLTVPAFAKPTAPLSITATAGMETVDIVVTPPASDGGSPVTSYLITASTGQAFTMTGTEGTFSLPPFIAVSFAAQAVNAVGAGAVSIQSTTVIPKPIVSTDPANYSTEAAPIDRLMRL